MLGWILQYWQQYIFHIMTMLQFCFWLSLSNHSPGNQVVHLSLGQPLLQQHLPGVVCANIKTLTGVCKYKKTWPMYKYKHCQRHNGPEGWVLITSSNTNLDQISSSESRPSIIFKISTKHQPLHKTWASKSWPNLASESWPRLNFITTWSISSKTMTKPRFILDSTFYKTSAEKNWPNSSFKSCLNFKFKSVTKPQQQIVANTILISNSYNINKFWVGIFTRQDHINQVY